MARLTAAGRLGRELRRLRQQQGLSQRALVRALGLSAHSNLVQYELGRRLPPGDIVVACERLLGAEAGSLRRLRAEALAERARAGAPGEPRGPAMLPAAVADFTGRADELHRLAELAAAGTSTAPALIIPAIAGSAGVGKTALAVTFAHQVADRYPDGQLYVDLRGYAPSPPLAAEQALAVLLHALRVPAEQVPADAERATGLYRSLLAGKRMLVLLDNAHSAGQVRPLLPGAPGCLVLVTSRDRLGGLIARDGARRLALDVLAPAEAAALLARILGPGRVATEPAAVAELARLCAHLPLALRIAAANLVDEPSRRIADYVAELRADDPLAVLAVAGDEQGAVQVAFASSYSRLPAPARRLFRLVGLLPGPDVSADAVAGLAAVGRPEAAGLLRRLAAANLLAEPTPGRFACHDLLRRYAADRARQEDAAADRAAALARLHAWYLAGAAAAADLLYPSMALLTPATPAAAPAGAAASAAPAAPAGAAASATPAEPVVQAASAAPRLDTGSQALAWLEAERANLVATVGQAAADGPYRVAWLLADLLRGYFWLRLYAADWLATARAGLAAAQADGADRAAAAARLSLADAYQSQGRHAEALEQYSDVLAGSRQLRWSECQLATLNGLGRVYWLVDRLDEAADHLSQALAIDRATGSVGGQAVRLANLGAIYHEMGRLALAADQFSEALAIARRTGQRRGEGICLANLGMAQHGLGRLDGALDHLAAALAVVREIGDAATESHVLRVLAEVHTDAGRDAAAVEQAEAAVSVAAGLDDREYELETLTTLARVHGRRGDHPGAADRFARALALARELDARYPQIVALIGLSAADRGLGRPEQALAHAEQALDLAGRTGYRLLAGQAGSAVAAAQLGLDRPAAAAQSAEAALAIHREAGHRLGAARTLVILGRARQAAAQAEQPAPAAARAAWAAALELFAGAGAREAEDVAALLG